MNKKSVLLAAGLALCSAAAFAEGDANTPFDPRWAAQEQAREARINQDRADFYNYNNSSRYAEPAYAPPAYNYRDASGQECWNPHARHFEAVRPGERQDDLDFSRCRSERGYGERRWRY
jgi:hypothetical protein